VEPATEDTPEEIDRQWAEAPVSFGGAGAAPAGCGQADRIVARFAPDQVGDRP
jgi:hypothetical protein